jgi:competence protein ComEC
MRFGCGEKGGAILRATVKWIFGGLLLGTSFFVLSSALAPHVLVVEALSVGNGDAILVHTPRGVTGLIDAGEDASVVRALGEVLPFWQRSLAFVIETSSTTASVGGLANVEKRYQVEKMYPLSQLTRGTRFSFGDGVVIDTLFADSKTAVLRMVYGKTSFLFSGDVSTSTRKEIETLDAHDGELSANVTFVPHQGAPGSVASDWLRAFRPTTAVISVGAQNRYGYPASSTLETLQAAHINVKRTDLSGSVRFTSDSASIK